MSKTLNELFLSFAQYGTRQPENLLDGAKFAKLFKDCKIVGKELTPTDLDIIFSKVKTKGARKITFPEFQAAMEEVAAKKKLTVAELEEKLLTGTSSPQTQATKPDYVKFHDDKSTYTGVHAKGGPTTVDASGQLSDLLDRSPADVRGIKK